MPALPVPAVGIRARGWGWRHPGRIDPAVHDLELDVQPGERVLLLGPSGAGKSTLLHALAGVLGDDDEAEQSGTLLLDGAAPQLRRGRSGLMQQDPDTQIVLSRVGDDVAFGAENLAVEPEEIWRRVREALDDVGLGRRKGRGQEQGEERGQEQAQEPGQEQAQGQEGGRKGLALDHPTAALSGGQKQRLALAGILAMRPGLLLLDEPTANLDPAGVLEVRDAVGRSLDKTGATLVVVEHRVAVWKPLVDRIVVLAPGRDRMPGGVLLDGAPDAVLEQARELLESAGIWVPGYIPATRARRSIGHWTGCRQPGGAQSGGPQSGCLQSGRGRNADILLAAEELAVTRERSRRRKPAVAVASGIDTSISPGQALTVTGPNGIGKSTFALTLAGLLPPAGGRVRAGDALAAGAGPDPYRWKAVELITRIGTVFQEPEHQFVTGNVLDELLFGPRHLGRGQERVEELLVRLRLEHLVEANPFTLSGGEKRRLSVATVLAASPQLLVLDEPTFGQDANTWAELASLLSELLDEGTAVVSVTHDAEFSAALGGAELHLGRSAVLAGGMR